MKRSGGVSGAVSLVMIFCVLCLAVFAVLTLSTAVREQGLAELTAQRAREYYEADADAVAALVAIAVVSVVWEQYFRAYTQDNMPRYAILLDMVGGIDAKFHREYFSNNYARNIVDKVWGIAARSGYSDRFVNLDGGAVVDDHLYLNRAGIPAIDIIESKNEVTKSFSPTWHRSEEQTLY